MADEVDNVRLGESYYPWTDWTNGKTWIAHPGRDYKTSTSSFRAYLYEKANSLGMAVTTKVTKGYAGNESVTFQFSSTSNHEGKD